LQDHVQVVWFHTALSARRADQGGGLPPLPVDVTERRDQHGINAIGLCRHLDTVELACQ